MAGRLLFTSAGLLALTFRVAANPTPTCRSVEHNANFDDLKGISGNELNPIPTPYMTLDFQGFQFAQVLQTNAAPGVLPHSPSNYAAASVVTELGGTPMFSVYYPNGTQMAKSFSLENFYFGCVVNLANAAAAAPAQCNIQITGYRGSDNSISNAQQVCSQQFQYNPTSALGVQQMAFSGAVNGCQDIQFAIVTFTPPGGAAATAVDLALLLDDVKYSTCA